MPSSFGGLFGFAFSRLVFIDFFHVICERSELPLIPLTGHSCSHTYATYPRDLIPYSFQTV